jgi:hypothetical protein
VEKMVNPMPKTGKCGIGRAFLTSAAPLSPQEGPDRHENPRFSTSRKKPWK